MRSSLVKSGLTLASPGGKRWLSILIYHRVLQRPDPLLSGLIDVRGFDDQIASMARSFNLLPLQEAIERLAEGKLPPRAAAVTFDDGYADNCEAALPILRKYGVHATFFIAAGYLDGGFMWNDGIIEAVRRCGGAAIEAEDLDLPSLPIASESDRKRTIVKLVTRLKYLPAAFREEWTRRLLERVGVAPPTQLIMTSDQVLQLAKAGMGIGGHTDVHPILTKVSLDQAREHIVAGRQKLQAIIGKPIRLFAYPNGRPGIDFGPQHVRLVRELGFDAALSTRWGAVQTGDDLFQLPRFTSWGRSEFRFQVRMALNIMRSRLDLPSPPYWELSN